MNRFFRLACVGTFLLVVVGCGKGPQLASNGAPAAKAMPVQPVVADAGPVRQGFAARPDRGELMAYPRQAAVHDGAYTWHRTDLSEAHALNAIADGNLRVTTPSGETLVVRYDHHIEHASGDWTWVGHIPGQDGAQTILTFGAHAAFGSIAQPGKPPLRLTVRNGVSWLVETDPSKVAGIINAATRPQRPDYRIPPKTGVPDSTVPSTPAPSMASAPVMAAATTTTATTVDLVLGYTPAFASDYGGQSGAITRLNFLVDVTNTSYTNSNINARVRLVATVPVSYPDNTSNDTTLDQLTGYDSSSNTTTSPSSAFSALRAAREQYGADLVSMVRSFRDPENGGCGVGWLIGGGQQGISTSDSYYGYSVVSDGSDAGTDGHTYFCLDETLAHELGHNMGAQHDVDTAKGTDGVLNSGDYGAYAYSFGYKNATNAFYTIMAYGDSGQHIYRIFSDPRSTFCGGAACGSAQADNAMTLTKTIPVVAGFRATTVSESPAPILLKELDANGNGTSDLLFRSHSAGRFVIWFMSGTTRIAYATTFLANGYSLVGTGDFNGDHRTDLLWSSGHDLLISMSSGAGYSNITTPYTFAQGTQVLGAADINNDGKADILLRNEAAGVLAVWYMDGANRVAYQQQAIPPQYRFIGAADMNKDGRQDLVWTTASQQLLVSFNTGNSFTSTLLALTYSPDYTLAGVTDVNGDHAGDLLFRSEPLGKLVTWFMSGTSRIAFSSQSISGAYHLVGKGNFNGDRLGDLVWKNGNGNVLVSLSTGSSFSSALLPYTYSLDYPLMDVQ
ncbi:reprolysin-like metallopeptidase [Cognatiluteimonas profundi]|uniref:reprolysin-like metallopeptidase n=1 Tax=Cognatiluteimonas profundi TaxID=2594501 RepID=UPI00131C8D79|nr:FG-GAP-like repeat-containing protein [Lysobacter profundi]